MRNAATLLILGLCVGLIHGLLAFPGAEGYGKNAAGGRGGKVVHVTNLNYSGAGSFKSALAVAGPKIIVFDVGGVLKGAGELTVPSFTTIAGQTAPGGFTLENGGLYTLLGGSTRDVIIRFIRVRGSYRNAQADCIRLTGCRDVIVDHCSASWNMDETMDATHSVNITFQNTYIAESNQNYNYSTAFLCYDMNGRLTIYRCFFVHHAKRTPAPTNDGLAPVAGGIFEFIGNVLYNCRPMDESWDEHGNNRAPLNLIGNYYKGGPNASYPAGMPSPHRGPIPKSMAVHCSLNVCESSPNVRQELYFQPTSAQYYRNTPFDTLQVSRLDSARVSRDYVLRRAGVVPHDSMDRRNVAEMETGTGAWRVDFDQPRDTLYVPGHPKPLDTDRDGMPDAWEQAHGLNPADSTDYSVKMSGGYDAIEAYVNELADSLINAQPMLPYPDASEKVTRVHPAGAALTLSPNPFGPALSLALDLPRPGFATVAVYRGDGRLVNILLRGTFARGRQSLSWNGRDSHGTPVLPGCYVVRLTSQNNTWTQRVVLLK